MDCEFHFQDPASPDTVYLLEAVIDASRCWDRFLSEHANDLRTIDERAAQNVVRGRRRLRDAEPDLERAPAVAEPAAGPLVDVELPVGRTDRFLVAQVPRAGGRWHQIHFNRDVIENFFRVRLGATAQRVFLVECRHDGTFAEQEVRPCVYSGANMNPKIEIASRHGAPYPDSGRPIAVYRELQVRSFAYMLLMPGDPGYDEMFALTEDEDLQKVGRGVPRVFTDTSRIRRFWAACPLVTAIDELVENDE